MALSCSKNHLFVLPSGGGRSSVYGTDPHFDSASGALPWWRSRTHSGGRMVGVSPSAWFVSLVGRSVPVHAASKDVAALSAARTWPHQGAHSGRGGRQRPLRRLGALGARSRLCDPTSTVVQPRQDVDNKGDGRAEHALHFGDRVRWVRMSQRSSDHSANVVAEPTAMN